MKNLFLLLLLFLLISTKASAGITLLANTCANGNGSAVTTSAINTTGASLIVIGLTYQVGTSTTPSDNQSNTWTGLTEQASNDPTAHFYYKSSPTTSASHTFTDSGTSAVSICVLAFSGTLSSSPFDVQNGGHNNASATLQPGSVTPGQNNELIISQFSFNVAGTASVDSSFIIPASNGQVNFVPGTAYGDAVGYIVQSAAAAVNPTWTSGGGSGELVSAIATFKATPVAVATTSIVNLNNARLNNANLN